MKEHQIRERRCSFKCWPFAACSKVTFTTLLRYTLIAIFITVMPIRVVAQQDDDATYRKIITEALNEYNRGNWDEAISLFRQAHAIKPSARTLRGLGIASYEARRYVEALSTLREALRDTRNPLTQEQKAESERMIEKAQGFVGRFAIRVQPATASITVDGREAIIEQDRLLLDPGRREIVVKADGYETTIRHLTVDGGSSGELDISLKPLPATRGSFAAIPKKQVGESDQTAIDEPSEDLLPWVVLGTSSAVAITGTVLLVLALNDISTVENAKAGTPLDEIKDAHDRVPTLSALGYVFLGLGLAGATAGVVLLATSEQEESEQTSLTLTPNGLSIRGRL